MKKSVIFGAGSVGRGFIGQLFSESGFQVTFVDVVPAVVEGINMNHSYVHITVSNNGYTTKTIENAYAIYSNNEPEVIKAILEADILATSVGAKVLPLIAGVIAKGLQERFSKNLPPLNIMLCENLHHAAAFMRDQIYTHLGEQDQKIFEENTGLLETSIGRMIPVPSEETKAIHPAAVCVEPYKFLPYDVHAVKGTMPEIVGLIGDRSVPFMFYSDRKLYIHNMGHCLCAYLGEFWGVEFISDAIEIPEIRYFVRSAMLESALALSRKYEKNVVEINEHVDDLLTRFGNTELKDTVVRVGRDPNRKMAPGDRFLGAYSLSAEMEVPHRYLSLAVAFGLNKLLQENNWTMAACEKFLYENLDLTIIKKSDFELILQQLQAIRGGVRFGNLISTTCSGFAKSQII